MDRPGAGTAILVIGIFAALDQLQIAPVIVNGLFYALLAIIVGVAIVAFGGAASRRLAGIGIHACEDVAPNSYAPADP